MLKYEVIIEGVYMSFSNKRPTEDGHYWLMEKTWRDGKLEKIPELQIVYVTISDNIDTMEIGDECGGRLINNDPMIEKYKIFKEMPFMFDPVEIQEKKRAKGKMTVKKEHWIMKIETPKMKIETPKF